MSYLPHVTFKDMKERLTIYTEAGRNFAYFIVHYLAEEVQFAENQFAEIVAPSRNFPICANDCFVYQYIDFSTCNDFNVILHIRLYQTLLVWTLRKINVA